MCTRRAENFRKFCNSFARFWRNLCVISTPNARLFGSERISDSGQLQRRFSACVALAGRVHAIFARAARRICLKILRASLAQNLLDIDARRALFFAFGCLYDSVKTCNDILRLTQRMLAEFRQFLCARRAKISGILQLFRASFARRFA